MRYCLYLAAYLLGSMVIALLVGRFIYCGSGDED
jgi:glycerol-3-phosphate acyltransferase PlsY